MCVCCVRERLGGCVCVSVCVCVWRERDSKWGKLRVRVFFKRESERK